MSILFIIFPMHSGHYQLAIYKTKKEKYREATHVVSKSTYIGTEKGGIYW